MFRSAIASFLLSAHVASACDLALVLAVDVSGSVDPQEYRVQMDGLAEALRDGVVAEALLSQNAMVTLIQWTGSSRQRQTLPWTHMDTFARISAFADAIEDDPRIWRNYSTAIGEALELSIESFEDVPQCRRRVIDVSGDGYSNEGVEPLAIRQHLVEDGFTINGLAIEGSAEKLTEYYRDFVIAGPKSFVMTANTFDEYPKRIKQKLFREVTNQVATLTVYDKAL